jgi:multiple sugar transport system permease protein
LLWQYFYDPGDGLFNRVLRTVHLPTSQWVESPRMAMISLVLVATWMNMGAAVILYLAGLKAIPSELYEAAEIDGATVWQRFRHITLPSMRYLLLVLLLLQVIATMQVFTEPYLLTGTTDPATVTVMVLVYRYAFSVNQDIGLAAAMSMVLFVVLAVLSAVYLWLTRSRTP